ncbi:MAG: rRNA adenine N-6-methyltransferase family protein, partial [Patescibacteria group bacterium]|nr:rRNA adenine N-6-methyltransferase family protein [Patescibacteria group bacterium]
ICASPGEMSILSVTAQFFGKCEIVEFVPKESFFPVPKVDSAIIKITTFENNSVLRDESKQLFPIVKSGFASRRKTLMNNLCSGLQISKQVAKEILQASSLDENVRAQDLSVEQWKALTNQAHNHL